MCSTCEDPKSTNPDLCGAARAARREEAHRVVQAYEAGKKFIEIAEAHGCSKARVYKLWTEGLEVINRDKRAELEAILSKLDDDIVDAQRDVDELAGPERVSARESLWKLQDRKAKFLNLYPPKEAIIKTGPAAPPAPPPEVLGYYQHFKEQSE
jgi:hypothetical protein